MARKTIRNPGSGQGWLMRRTIVSLRWKPGAVAVVIAHCQMLTVTLADVEVRDGVASGCVCAPFP